MTTRYKKNLIDVGSRTIAVYASPKISTALDIVTAEMSLIQGVKLVQVLEAMYEQGKKDGARSAFEVLHGKIKEAEKAVPHNNPGRPKKK